MAKKKRWQFRIATWFWIVFVVATFFFGRNWDDTWGPLFRQNTVKGVRSGATTSMSVSIPAMGPAPAAIDFAWPQQSSETDEAVFSFAVGISR